MIIFLVLANLAIHLKKMCMCVRAIHFTNLCLPSLMDAQKSDFINPQKHQFNPNQEKNFCRARRTN